MGPAEAMVALTSCNILLTMWNLVLTRLKREDDKFYREIEHLEREMKALSDLRETILFYRREFQAHRDRIDTAAPGRLAANYRHDMSKFAESLLCFFHQGHFCEELCEAVHDMMREFDRIAGSWPRNEGREVHGYAETDFPHIQQYFRAHPQPVTPQVARTQERQEASNDRLPAARAA